MGGEKFRPSCTNYSLASYIVHRTFSWHLTYRKRGDNFGYILYLLGRDKVNLFSVNPTV